MCFVADTTKRKGDARWKLGIFLTKAVTNDMFLVHCEGNVRLTRSVKAIYKDWSEHMGLYRTLVVPPWHIDGTIGTRIDPAGVQGSMEGAPALDDEPGEDPPDVEAEEPFVGVPVDLTPNASFQSRMKPPPDTAAVAGPVTPTLVPVQSAKPTTQGSGLVCTRGQGPHLYMRPRAPSVHAEWACCMYQCVLTAVYFACSMCAGSQVQVFSNRSAGSKLLVVHGISCCFCLCFFA